MDLQNKYNLKKKEYVQHAMDQNVNLELLQVDVQIVVEEEQ